LGDHWWEITGAGSEGWLGKTRENSRSEGRKGTTHCGGERGKRREITGRARENGVKNRTTHCGRERGKEKGNHWQGERKRGEKRTFSLFFDFSEWDQSFAGGVIWEAERSAAKRAIDRLARFGDSFLAGKVV
jgi:hypothetical protein